MTVRRLSPQMMAQATRRRAERLAGLVRTMRRDAALRYVSGRRERLDRVGSRFTGALVESMIERHLDWLQERGERIRSAARHRHDALHQRLAALDRVRETAGYEATLARGYAVVWSGEHVVTETAAARAADVLSLQFADGTVEVGAATTQRKRRMQPKEPEQGSLF